MNPKMSRAEIPVSALPVLNPSVSKLVPPNDAVLPDDILPLSLKTVAQIVDKSDKTVRRWIQRGLLRSHKLGGSRVVRKCDLRSFLDQQAGETNKEHP